jgi:hypothetical protein
LRIKCSRNIPHATRIGEIAEPNIAKKFGLIGARVLPRATGVLRWRDYAITTSFGLHTLAEFAVVTDEIREPAPALS